MGLDRWSALIKGCKVAGGENWQRQMAQEVFITTNAEADGDPSHAIICHLKVIQSEYLRYFLHPGMFQAPKNVFAEVLLLW